MEVTKKYKIYSHLFYGYILIYHFFLIYVMKFSGVTLKTILTDNGFLGIFIYIIIILFNKTRLYYREMKDEEFWLLRSYGVDPTKMEQILAVIKSIIVNFIYFIFNYEVVSDLIYQLEGTNANAGLLLTVLQFNYFQ